MNTTLTCANCYRLFEKENKELNRRKRLGFNVFYCSISCSMSVVNSQSDRRELNSFLAKQNFSNLVNQPEFISQAHYGSQKWKYVEIERYLKSIGIFYYQFEYPIVDPQGIVRLYDLCLPLHGLLIEFDGPNHIVDKAYAQTTDLTKTILAEDYGWLLVRISVQPNTVIPSSVGESISFHL